MGTSLDERADKGWFSVEDDAAGVAGVGITYSSDSSLPALLLPLSPIPMLTGLGSSRAADDANPVLPLRREGILVFIPLVDDDEGTC